MCPGPDECPQLRSAAQDSPDPAENERNRDAACAEMGRRCARRVAVDPGLIRQVERIESLVRQRRAGFSLDEEGLSDVEREGIIWWCEVEEAYRRADAKCMRELYLLLRARTEAGI